MVILIGNNKRLSDYINIRTSNIFKFATVRERYYSGEILYDKKLLYEISSDLNAYLSNNDTTGQLLVINNINEIVKFNEDDSNILLIKLIIKSILNIRHRVITNTVNDDLINILEDTGIEFTRTISSILSDVELNGFDENNIPDWSSKLENFEEMLADAERYDM